MFNLLKEFIFIIQHIVGWSEYSCFQGVMSVSVGIDFSRGFSVNSLFFIN